MQFTNQRRIPMREPKHHLRTVKEFLLGTQSFENEFKKQVRMLITFTLGFTIAFSWRQTTFDTAESLVEKFTHFQSATSLSIATSFFITIISLLVIFIAARLLHDKFEH